MRPAGSFASALAWLNQPESRAIVPGELPVVDGCIKHPQLAQHISKLHTGLTACIGSSGRVERLLLLAEPPHLDTGEITDKGYINQRKVMERRAAFINRLYADDPEDVVIVAGS